MELCIPTDTCNILLGVSTKFDDFLCNHIDIYEPGHSDTINNQNTFKYHLG